MPTLAPLRSLLDGFSQSLKTISTRPDQGDVQAFNSFLEHYSVALASAFLSLAAPNETNFVIVWPGINLRRGSIRLKRTFPTAPRGLDNSLPIKNGAVIRCSACPNCPAGTHDQALASLYTFDYLLSDNEHAPLRPPLGTHDWLLSEPSFSFANSLYPLWVLRVTPYGDTETIEEEASILRPYGIWTARLPYGDRHFGRNLGQQLDSAFPHVGDIATNKLWPHRAGYEPRSAEELSLHRRLYDLWLTAIFEPRMLAKDLQSDRQLAIPPALVKIAQRFGDCGIQFREWLSWRLSPTVPVLPGDTPDQCELASELGSLMILTSFSFPSRIEVSELACLLDDVRHITEHAWLKIRVADDAVSVARKATAEAVSPVHHELRKWASALRTLFRSDQPEVPWNTALETPWLSTALHRQTATLYADAITFITLPIRTDLGLLNIPLDISLREWVRRSFLAATQLLSLALLPRLKLSLDRDLRESASILEEYRLAIAQIPLSMSGDCVDDTWVMLSAYLPFSHFTEESISLATHMLVTNFLNFLKHGLWCDGVNLTFNFDDVSLVLEAFNAPGDATQWEGSFGEALTKALFETQASELNKLCSSTLTLRYLEKESSMVTSRLASAAGDQRVEWGLKILPSPREIDHSAMTMR